jgi:hypothetical protein
MNRWLVAILGAVCQVVKALVIWEGVQSGVHGVDLVKEYISNSLVGPEKARERLSIACSSTLKLCCSMLIYACIML